MKRQEHWAIIQTDIHDQPDFVRISNTDPQKVYWFGTASQWSGEFRILAEWWGGDPDEHEVEFYRNFYIYEPLAELVQSAGWLAPDGKFYGCEWGEHRHVAYILHGKYYNTLGGADNLREKGWFTVHRTGIVGGFHRDKDRFTDEQVVTVGQLAKVGDVEWRETLLRNLKLYTEE